VSEGRGRQGQIGAGTHVWTIMTGDSTLALKGKYGATDFLFFF